MKGQLFHVILTTVPVKGSQAKAPYARPVAGQGLPTDMRVDCCTAMRNSGPLGSHFDLLVELVDRQTGRALYAARGTPFEMVSAAEAQRRIRARGPVVL